jgi:uncharacterized protein YndB with AHSA1/START domain
MSNENQSRSVTHELFIECRPETLFPFFTDPAKMTLWIGRHVLLEPIIGGAFRIDINGDHIAVGEYVELVPCEKVVLTWGWTNSQLLPPGSSTVEFRLYPEANGTRLVLTHSGLPAAGIPSQLQGWLHYTSRLQVRLAATPVPIRLPHRRVDNLPIRRTIYPSGSQDDHCQTSI